MSTSPREPQRGPAEFVTFAQGARVTAKFVTSMGSFTCTLHAAQCPMTVGNFVGLARGDVAWSADDRAPQRRPLYDGTVFHRIIKNFMIQGGDPKGTGMGGPGYRFNDEFVTGLRHSKPGVLSMANSGPNTNGSQFFVTDAATPWLDGRHTVFGEVSQGIEVVQNIAQVATDADNRPRQTVTLQQVQIHVEGPSQP